MVCEFGFSIHHHNTHKHFNDKSLNLKKVMNFTLVLLEHANADIRKRAVDLVIELN